jgi:hypothetical protein
LTEALARAGDNLFQTIYGTEGEPSPLFENLLRTVLNTTDAAERLLVPRRDTWGAIQAYRLARTLEDMNRAYGQMMISLHGDGSPQSRRIEEAVLASSGPRDGSEPAPGRRESASGSGAKAVEITRQAQEALPEAVRENLLSFLKDSERFKNIWRIVVDKPKGKGKEFVFRFHRADGTHIEFTIVLDKREAPQALIEKVAELYGKRKSEFHSGRKGLVYWMSRSVFWVLYASLPIMALTMFIRQYEDRLQHVIFTKWVTEADHLGAFVSFINLWSLGMALPAILLMCGAIAI